MVRNLLISLYPLIGKKVHENNITPLATIAVANRTENSHNFMLKNFSLSLSLSYKKLN